MSSMFLSGNVNVLQVTNDDQVVLDTSYPARKLKFGTHVENKNLSEVGLRY